MRRLPIALLIVAAAGSSAGAQIMLYARGVIPADATDLSGLTQALPGRDGATIPANRLGGFGSAIDYAGEGFRFVVLPDRGPADGKAEYPCRMHEMELVFPLKRESDASPGPAQVEWTLLRTVLLRDEGNKPLVGLVSAVEPTESRGTRLDPEGVRLLPGGASVLISDEYGPFVEQHDLASGLRQRRYDLPERFAQPQFDTDPDQDKPTGATRGRDRNRGLEGLALSPDGGIATAIIQSPLLQDKARQDGASGKRLGVNCRMLQIALTPGPDTPGATREFVYPLEDPKLVVSELLAIDDTRFLVLERDGKAGEEALVKRLYMIDTATATDVSGLDALPKGELPDHIAPVRKALWLDMLAPDLGILGPDVPEKWEGLSFGPTLADGRRTIVVISDNDFRSDQPTHVWVFAFQPDDLAWPKAGRPAPIVPTPPAAAPSPVPATVPTTPDPSPDAPGK
jgi:hypothetical protein